ncbi:hypothetical protein DBA32_12380 [Escherichia coli]|nr:hypothetical protein DBA32_12380 [Escherichia coli]
MLPSETMIWQPEFTDKTLSRKPGAVQPSPNRQPGLILLYILLFSYTDLLFNCYYRFSVLICICL